MSHSDGMIEIGLPVGLQCLRHHRIDDFAIVDGRVEHQPDAAVTHDEVFPDPQLEDVLTSSL
jgi:hypothetical protein